MALLQQLLLLQLVLCRICLGQSGLRGSLYSTTQDLPSKIEQNTSKVPDHTQQNITMIQEDTVKIASEKNCMMLESQEEYHKDPNNEVVQLRILVSHWCTLWPVTSLVSYKWKSRTFAWLRNGKSSRLFPKQQFTLPDDCHFADGEGQGVWNIFVYGFAESVSSRARLERTELQLESNFVNPNLRSLVADKRLSFTSKAWGSPRNKLPWDSASDTFEAWLKKPTLSKKSDKQFLGVTVCLRRLNAHK